MNHARKEEYKKRTAKPAVTCNHTNCSDTGGDYNKHGFTLSQHFLQRNDGYKYICFYGSETYKKVIYFTVEVWEVVIFLALRAPPSRVTCASGSPNACLRSPMRRKKLRRFCKQDKAWRDIVGNKLSIRKIFLNIKLPS